MGDRSGGREVKGASLKKSKKNPGGVNARGKKAEKVYSGPAESAGCPPPGPQLYFDCGAALLSRQFERDRDRVLERARGEGNVAAIVIWFSDVEKQHLLSDACTENSGLCYSVVGVHPDNIDKTNKRSHEAWMLRIEELARKPECVGILSGYNLGRDVATHFAQESLLKTSCALCEKLLLPLVLHVADGESLSKCIEILRAEGWTAGAPSSGEASSSRRVILHDAVTACGGDADRLAGAVGAGFMCAISAAGITDPDPIVSSKARTCIATIPLGQLLVCSDSPWKTPQNLPDPYLRTMRNEPSNLPSIVQAVAESVEGILKDLGDILRRNSMRAFGMDGEDGEEDEGEGGDTGETREKGEKGEKGEKHAKKDKSKEEDRDDNEGHRKGKKKSKQALLQIFAANDMKKKELASERTLDSDSNSDECDVPVKTKEKKQDASKQQDKEDKDGREDKDGKEGREVRQESLHFSCHKCRAPLFTQGDVLTHALDAVRTVFKVGEEGLCKSGVFLSYPYEVEDTHMQLGKNKEKEGREGKEGKEKKSKSSSKFQTSTQDPSGKPGGQVYFNLRVHGDTVECAGCGVKLGRYRTGEAPCPCGILVPGPAVRINAAKVDFLDVNLDADTLAARSRNEAENSNMLDELEEGEIQGKGSKKDKKKKMKSENKGNFSSYRNKSFVKGASRLPRDGEEKDEDESEEEEDEETKEIREIKEMKEIKDKKSKKNKKAVVVSDSESDD